MEPGLLLRRIPGFGFVEKRLQNEGGGDLIDDLTVLLAGVAGLVKDLVGFVRGQPLVPQVDRQAGELAQLFRKGLRFCGLRTCFTGEADGIADDDGRNCEFASQTAEGAKVFAAAALAFKGKDRLGSQSELVGDGDADSAIADIESQETRGRSGRVRAVHSPRLRLRRQDFRRGILERNIRAARSRYN